MFLSKKPIMLVAIITLSIIILSGCGISDAELDTAKETAYDLGYDNGYAFGYAAGYTDSMNGKTDINVFSDVSDDVDTSSYVYYIVESDDKIYHTNNCSDTIGKQLWYFTDQSLAEAAGFDPCKKCYQ